METRYSKVFKTFEENISFPESFEMPDPPGVWTRTDNTTENVSPANGKTFTLEELQYYVSTGHSNSLIQVLDCNKFLLIINEEGKLLGLPLNEMATMFYQTCFGPVDVIVGDALIAKKGTIE